MENVYPGPQCEALKLTCHNIDEGNIPVQYKCINNGVVLELHKYLKSDINYVIKIIQKLCTDLSDKIPQTLRSKISRLLILRRTIKRKKHHKYADFKEFLDSNFSVKPRFNSQVISDCQPRDPEEREAKLTHNFLQYKITKKNKTLRQLSNKISKEKSNLNDLKKQTGHYSVKNVDKRDELLKKNLQNLHGSQQVIKKQKVLITRLLKKMNTQRVKSKRLKLNNKYLRKQLAEKDSEALLLKEVKKKRAAQKSVSHYKNKNSKLLDKHVESIQAMDIQLKEKNQYIQKIEAKIEILSAQIVEY